MVQEFDLIVIGGGAGLDVASGLAGTGIKVALVERGPPGGTCLNRGCIPSKMLLHSADVAETIRTADRFGIHVKGYTVDFASIVRRVSSTVDHDAAEIARGLQTSTNPRWYASDGRFVGPKTLQVGSETLRAERIVIASGGRPAIPEIPGLREAGFMTSDQALRLEVQPGSLTIIGGGYIAAELAHFFGALGTEVHIVQRGPTLVPREDEEVARQFTEIARQKYDVHTQSATEKVTKRRGRYELVIRAENGGGRRTIESEQLLVATGRQTNADGLDLAKTGVKTDARGFVVTNEFLETNVPGIVALGDAVGHFLFRHSANLEAQYDYFNLLDPTRKSAVDYRAMPHAIFASPQIAGVGQTEQELRSGGVDYVVGREPYSRTGMGLALQDQTGFAKILVDRQSRRIFGCHVLGPDASTLIHEVVVAMRSGEGSLRNLTRAVHAHPSLSEVISRAALNVE